MGCRAPAIVVLPLVLMVATSSDTISHIVNWLKDEIDNNSDEISNLVQRASVLGSWTTSDLDLASASADAIAALTYQRRVIEKVSAFISQIASAAALFEEDIDQFQCRSLESSLPLLNYINDSQSESTRSLASCMRRRRTS